MGREGHSTSLGSDSRAQHVNEVRKQQGNPSSIKVSQSSGNIKAHWRSILTIATAQIKATRQLTVLIYTKGKISSK